MKRLFYASVWLFFLPALLVLHGMRELAFWLIRQLPDGPAWPGPGEPSWPGRSRRPRGRLP